MLKLAPENPCSDKSLAAAIQGASEWAHVLEPTARLV